MAVEVSIRPCTPSDKLTLMDMVNKVYSQCEGYLWVEGHKRITSETYEGYYTAKNLVVALKDEVIVGCVVINEIDRDTKGVSMLVVNPEYRRQGIGRKLVDYIVQCARKADCAKVRVELLYSRHSEDKWKLMLRGWYTSLGFEFVKNDDFSKYFPGDMLSALVVETTFSIFEKPLK